LFFFERFSRTNKTPEELIYILSLDIQFLIDPFVKYAVDMRIATLTDQFLEEVKKFSFLKLRFSQLPF